MLSLFHQTTFKCSKIFTQAYSTSFTLGIQTLQPRFHQPIYAIYGFVRLADEIVDSFHGFDKQQLLFSLKENAFLAIEQGISLNPILHAWPPLKFW